MTALAAETKSEKVAALREAAGAKWREARTLRDRAEALEQEAHALEADAYEAAGDHDHAEFYRALSTPGANAHAAYVRLRAKQYVRSGEHYDKELAASRAEIEAEAARLVAATAAASPVVGGMAALGAALVRNPHVCICAGAGRIGDQPCPHCDAGKAGRAA